LDQDWDGGADALRCPGTDVVNALGGWTEDDAVAAKRVLVTGQIALAAWPGRPASQHIRGMTDTVKKTWVHGVGWQAVRASLE